MLRLNGYSTGRLRQVARDRRLGSQRLRADRPLADAFGLRQVLRLHRRRDQPVVAGALRRHDRVETPKDPELPLHDRHDQSGDQLDAVPEGAHAGQAVLHLLRPGRHPRAAPRARRNGSPNTRASSTRAGTSCAKRRWPGRIALGVVPAGTKLAPKPEAIKDWDKLTADEKKLFARQMEVFAGFGEYCRQRDRPVDRTRSTTWDSSTTR